MPLISIIVPIYKAEKYLHRCVDSILAQNYPDFELLLIDDGSPDNSGVICDEYAAYNNHVRVLHKENGGVSSARNLGLDNAKGEWITFIDSDDYVLPSYLSCLARCLDADWMLGGYQESIGPICVPAGGVYEGGGVIDFVNQYNGVHVVRACWGGLYKSEIIREHKLRFSTEFRFGEDSLFNSEYIIYCNRIRVIDSCDYVYCNENNAEDKYVLGISEIKSLFCAIIANHHILESIYGLKVNPDADVEILLGRYPLSELAERQCLQEYYLLCKKCYSNMSWNRFCSDEICSPIIRLISILKRMIEEGGHKDFMWYCEISNKVCGSISKCPKFKYKDFYIWYFLLKTKNYEVLNFIMKFYFSVKRIIYRIK